MEKKLGTRALIAVKTNVGYRSIHLAMDGGPQNAGRILCDHYASDESVLALMEGSDVMVLRSTPGECGRSSDVTGRPQPAQEHVGFADVEDALLGNTEHLYVIEGDRWTHCEVNLLAI